MLAVSTKIAGEHERAVVFRLGRLLPELRGLGVLLFAPLVDRAIRVNLLEETSAEAVEAHRFVGEQVVVERADTVRIATGAPWPARSADGSTLTAGERQHVESVEDDLRFVVGSPSSPILEEQS
jgi:hypothetical protein